MFKAFLAEWKVMVAGGLTALVLLSIGGAYLKGRGDGAALEKTKAMAELVAQIKERGITDAEVETMPVADLCARLGGVWNDGICE